MEREALKLALEALEEAQTNDDGMEKWDRNERAIAAIKEALAKPAQEPVAHVYLFDHEGRPRIAWDNAKGIKIGDKLYTAPPQRQWVGLTEKDFSAINQSCLTKLQAATSAESILKERNS